MAEARIDPQLREELAAIAGERGCELVRVEYQGGMLRLILDRAEGVRLEDCEAVSKQVSTLLDVADFGRGRYTLEVSSPGLDRQLYGPRDYSRFVGRRVRVRYADRETGRKATVVGRLAGFREAAEEIDVAEIEGGRDLTLRLTDIQLARLEIEW